MKLFGGLAAIAVLCLAGRSEASDTVTYTYDAKGRLVRVQHSGGPAAGVDTQYTYDKAGNRQRVLVTGGAAALSAAPADTAPTEASVISSDKQLH